VRILPICRRPVGLGANRTTGLEFEAVIVAPSAEVSGELALNTASPPLSMQPQFSPEKAHLINDGRPKGQPLLKCIT
jgi:hypothetical protein